MKTAFMVLRNGVRLGYPFVEAILSALPTVDSFMVVDCGSDDGTGDVLERISGLNGKVHIRTAVWPPPSPGGSSIAVATNAAMRMISATWPDAGPLFYVQADEVYHESDMTTLEMLLDAGRPASVRFLHFRNGFDRRILNPTYDRAVRIIDHGARSIQDGYSFDVRGAVPSAATVYHVGWCFPRQVCNKHINHCVLYPGSANYVRARNLCMRMLKEGRYDADRLCREVDADYRFGKVDPSTLPAVLKHLLDLDEYDGNRSVDVLSGRIREA